MSRALTILCLLFATLLTSSGCIIEDDGHFCEETEIIRYRNLTRLYVDNYIDGDYVGSVRPNGVFDIEGHFEGLRTFESFSENDILHWGPDDFEIFDGDLFVLELEGDGFFKARSESKPPQQ